MKKHSVNSNIIYAVILAASLLSFTSCEKVINVDLNEADPKIVIEGLINDLHASYSVTVSRSGSYFNQPQLPVVTDAIVIITDDFGIIDTLHQTIPGTYLTRRTRGIPGRTYKLRVLADGKEYTASSTMPYHVNIDSMKLLKSQIQHFAVGSQTEEIRHEIRVYFKDPAEKNFYRVKVFKNDSINTQNYRLYDDQYTNGQETELRATFAEAGNTYKIELLSLERSTYLYYRTLADLLYSNPFFGSTPANPTGNLSNGALGYFGTCTVSSRTVTITKEMLGSE